MSSDPSNPLTVQSDRTLLLETMHPRHVEARDALVQFAELVMSPGFTHTYRTTPLSLWNAAAAGHTAEEIIGVLEEFSKYPIPENILIEIREDISRYGRLKLEVDSEEGALRLTSTDPVLLTEIENLETIEAHLIRRIDVHTLLVRASARGHIKQALIKIGYPVEDLAGYTDGAALAINLRDATASGHAFSLRQYQQEAADIFHAAGTVRGGSGVIVLPCGAGKTIIGMGVIARLQMQTLVLTTNITALRQWRDELLDKTDLTEDLIGEYSGEQKDIRPITLTTYQILTHRRRRDEDFVHMGLFNAQSWGLVIYDEVHLLPAPVFRAVAEIQARRRLGLTATLVREDEKEDDVFSLIGPKRYDVPWKQLEQQGWIAEAACTEIRVPLASDLRMTYATADAKAKFRIASENPRKLEIVDRLLEAHHSDHSLVIGQYLDQLEVIRERTGAPIITGKTPSREREELYGAFKRGEIRVLIVSKVANFAVDLPDANVAIQVSGTFGSRQEEAQRLGRILRPKSDGKQAHFYSVVTRDTRDLDFAQRRQRFLTEQGYRYTIQIESDEAVEAVAPSESGD
jgi:DNA excision repair protein ERCC-3